MNIQGVIAAGHSVEEIRQLAKAFGNENRHFASARLFRAIVFSGVSSPDLKLDLLRSSLKAVERIPKSEQNGKTLTFEVSCN